jgi:2,3,4,5-tetrahydropyridine-2,6-dicarboxylate N-succinyltransferase
MTDHKELQSAIEEGWNDRTKDQSEAVDEVLDLLDEGEVRVASPDGDDWVVNEWVKQAVLLYFAAHPNQEIESGWFSYRDKVPVKRNFEALNVRVVPPATARYGSYLAPGVVLMPSYVNIGARVGENTMVDTWATVGSCAQIGRNVHLAGGVGIGGVLEPLQAAPVIIEDNAFIGSRCIVVEGARVGANAVLGANVVITASTPIIDVTGDQPVEYRGSVPANAIVIPGTRTKEFPAGTYNLPAGLIVGWRNPGMEDKVQLNSILREHGAAV